MSVEVGTEEQIQFAATGVFCNIDITSSICVPLKWCELPRLSAVAQMLLRVKLRVFSS